MWIRSKFSAMEIKCNYRTVVLCRLKVTVVLCELKISIVSCGF